MVPQLPTSLFFFKSLICLFAVSFQGKTLSLQFLYSAVSCHEHAVASLFFIQ